MWDSKPVTREVLEAMIAEARDEGTVAIAAPFADNVYEALLELAAAFPNPTPELADAVLEAFANPVTNILTDKDF